METVTNRVSNYVKEKGINIRALSKGTNITYEALYDSLSNSQRNRELRADEFLSICTFLEIDPLRFAKSED